MLRSPLSLPLIRSGLPSFASTFLMFVALAHTIESAVERAYREGRAVDKRRELMSAWANYCLGKPLEAGTEEPDANPATT